jgi:hypothetical protein
MLDTDSIASAVACGLLILETPFTLGGAIREDVNPNLLNLSIANINQTIVFLIPMQILCKPYANPMLTLCSPMPVMLLIFSENNSCQMRILDLFSTRSRDTTAVTETFLLCLHCN